MRDGLRIASITIMATVAACGGERGQNVSEAKSVFVSDSFDATDGTALEAHAAGKEWKWVKHTVRNPDTSLITNGRVHKDGGNGDAIYYVSATPQSGEYDVSADVHVASNVPMMFAGLCGRMSVDAKTMYVVWYSHSNTRWQLARFQSGSLSSLGEYIHQAEPGKTYRVTLQIRDDGKYVLIDGERRISTTDNSLADPGRPGLYFVSQESLGNKASQAGYHVDNFRAATR